MRSLGIDPGEARTGLALSDPLRLTARPFEVVRSRDMAVVIERIATLVDEQEVSQIVVGLPRNMDGTLGPQARITAEFAERLAARLPEISHTQWDERLSSVQAERILAEARLTHQKRKALRDMVAAQIILQSYLDAHREPL